MIPLAVPVLSLGLLFCRPALAAPLLANDACEALFNIAAPADVLRAHGKSGLTLLVNYQSEGDTLVFLLQPDACAVTRRQGGRETLLGRARVLHGVVGEGNVVVKRRPGSFAVVYGDATVLRGVADGPTGGRWGLADGTAAELGKLWCQPLGEVAFTDDFMRTAEEEHGWTAVTGSWQVAAVESAEYSANAFSFLGRQTDRHPALAVTGDWFWEDHTVGVSVRPGPDAAGFGVGLAYQPGPSLRLLRYLRQGPSGGAIQLVRVERDRERLLVEQPLTLSAGEWHRFTLSGVAGRLVGRVDGEAALTADDPGLAQGQIALWAAGDAPVVFDDVEAYSGPEHERPATVLAHSREAADPAAARFITDHYMEGWADESDQWAAGNGPSVWHCGYFWGDVDLTWSASPEALRSPAALHLCVPADGLTILPPTNLEAGYHLQLAPAAGDKLTLTLSRGGEARASATVAAPTEEARVTWRKVGNRLEAALNGGTVAAFEDPAPLRGGKVGLAGAAAATEAPHLALTTRNVLDSSFRSAPVEWRIGGGEWGVQSRWACTPRWSWFGGRSRSLTAIWTRDRYAGDLVVDFFASVPMDSPFAPFYRHPSNLAVTLGGDGRTPGSGYSLIYGAWTNRGTAIFRRGEVVARTTAFTLPDIIDSFGGLMTPDAGIQLHKTWRHIHAERLGHTVRLMIDGALALTYDDPDPLPGGPVGLWTLDNGLMIARARVYFEGTGDIPQAAGGKPTAGGAATPTATQGQSRSVTVTAPVACDLSAVTPLLVTNPVPGGDFRVSARNARGVDLRRTPLLSFDYALPADVRIDVYATLRGQRYRLRLNGPAEGADGTEEIGDLPGAEADGRWHHAEVDLGGRLRPFFAADESMVLDDLEFANHVQPEYLLVGIGGNGAGATYQLAHLAFAKAPVPKPPTPAPTAAPTFCCCDFERDLGCFRPWGADAGAVVRRARTPTLGNPSGGQWCLEVRNGQLGGLFGVEAACGPFEASQHPVVAFDYRAPDTLRVDLIVEVAGVHREVTFTDNDATWPVVGSLGAVADGRWHHAQVDLAALLRQAFPGRRSLPVTHLGFASSGWPGNREGVTYWLDNFELSEAAPAAGDDHTPPEVSGPSPGPGESAATRQVALTVTDAGSGVSPADLRLRVNGTDYTLADSALSFDETTGRLTWTAPGSAPLGGDGAVVTCALSARDLAGNGLPAPFAWTWRLDYGQDHQPPPAPVVSCFPSNAVLADTFASDKGTWGDFYGCQVLRRDRGGPTGPGCIELREVMPPAGGQALVRDLAADWARFPLLRLQYQAPSAAGTSVILNGTTFDGQTDAYTQLASLPGRDGEWQTLTVDLQKALQAADPRLTMHRLFLTVTTASPEDVALISDAVMYSPDSTKLRFVWGEPADPSAIRGYSWELDHADDTVPGERVRGAGREAEFTDLQPGHWCFHLRACDGAGNWGPARHVSVDLAPAPKQARLGSIGAGQWVSPMAIAWMLP